MPTYDEAIELLFTERINIELLLTTDDEGYMFFNFRARPWKNSPEDGRMLIAGSFTMEDAFCQLAEELIRSHWVPLNWKMRLSAPGVPAYIRERPAPKVRGHELEDPQEPTSIVKRRNATKEPPSEA